jgi:hypothetical protein
MAAAGLKKPLEKTFFTYVCFNEDELKPICDEIQTMYDFCRDNK